MSTLQDARSKEMYQEHFGTLTDETRQRIVRILHDKSGFVSEETLAEQLLAANEESNSEETTSDAMRTLQIRLHHIHLPKLADCGLVEWDKDAQTVATIDQSVYVNSQIEELLSSDNEHSAVSALTGDRLREGLQIIRSASQPIMRETLAYELASNEANGQPTENRIEDISVQLHHRHLPKLEAAGLVEYNSDGASVEYCGPSELTIALPGNVTDD